MRVRRALVSRGLCRPALHCLCSLADGLVGARGPAGGPPTKPPPVLPTWPRGWEAKQGAPQPLLH